MFRLVVLLAFVFFSFEHTQAQTTFNQQVPVSVQFDWIHQFEYAAFYAALKNGYYRDVNLDVTLIEGGSDIDAVEAVITGAAQFGVGNTSLLVDRYAGKPVVAVGALLQHSSIALLARRDRGIHTVGDLAGRTIQCFKHACDEIAAYLNAYGIRDDVKLDSTSISPDAFKRLDVVDATAVYLATEGFALRGREDQYVLLLPRSAGVDLYGDILFTSEAYLRKSPDIVERFRLATFKGLRFAMDNPSEVLDEILLKYNTQGKTRDQLLHEAYRMSELVRADLIEPGYMSDGRWRYIRDVYATLGKVSPDFDVSSMLYDFHPAQKLAARHAQISVLTVLAASGIGIAAAYIFFLNRRLRQTVRDLDAANAELKRLAHFDPLTRLPNRALLKERLGQVFEMALRDGFKFAVLMIDLDRFKPINDQHGHGVGDEVLTEVARRIRANIRASDTVGRFGGDEFVVVLAQVDALSGAETAADKIREAIQQPISVKNGSLTVCVGACLGIAVFPDHAQQMTELLRNADMAMYHAKSQGGHRCDVFRSDLNEQPI